VSAERLRGLLAVHLPGGPPVFAVDPTVWARCDAECSPGRGFSDHPSRHSAGQPIVAGWCYQLVVGLELQPDSWTAPVDVRRLDPADNHNLVAAGQVRALLSRLPVRQQAPLVVFDGGFDPVQLQVELAGTPVQVLVRIRSDRNFYAAGHPRRDGRPARHGAKLSLADPATWPAPAATWQEADPQYGQVAVTAWGGLHPRQRTYHDPDGQLTIVAGTLVRVHVSRLPGRSRAPKTLWLWWAARRGPPRTWRLGGGPTFAGSTSSTPSAFGSRPCTGPCPGPAPRSRPTGSPGPWRQPTVSFASPAGWSATCGCPGSGRWRPSG
jgi:DDE superfamily endonuclease